MTSGCGVDSVDEYFDPPRSDGHMVYCTTADRTQHYFGFYTTEVNTSTEVVFLGTEVYYKIYSNASSVDSVLASVEATSENSQATYLTGSRGYKSLRLLADSTPYPIIKASGSNRHVEIRLSDYSSYQKQVSVNSSSIGIPVRNTVSGGFNFKSGDSANPLPVSGDSDSSLSKFTVAGTYYVDMYAVSIGRNTADGTTYYSKVLHLGAVPIATPWTLN